MRAARIREFGGPRRLHVGELPTPSVAPDQMLVKLGAVTQRISCGQCSRCCSGRDNLCVAGTDALKIEGTKCKLVR